MFEPIVKKSLFYFWKLISTISKKWLVIYQEVSSKMSPNTYGNNFKKKTYPQDSHEMLPQTLKDPSSVFWPITNNFYLIYSKIKITEFIGVQVLKFMFSRKDLNTPEYFRWIFKFLSQNSLEMLPQALRNLSSAFLV